MRFLFSVLLTMVVAFATGLFLPWWLIAVAGFLVALVLPQSAGKAFLAGFIGLFILWVGMAFFISNANEHLFAGKIGMLILKSNSAALIILVTGLIGGLTAGFGSMAGSFLVPAKKV